MTETIGTGVLGSMALYCLGSRTTDIEVSRYVTSLGVYLQEVWAQGPGAELGS